MTEIEKGKFDALKAENEALKSQLEALSESTDSSELQAKYDELLVKYNELAKASNTAAKIPNGSFKVEGKEYTFKPGHLTVNISGTVYKSEELMADAEKNVALLEKLVKIGYRGLKIVE